MARRGSDTGIILVITWTEVAVFLSDPCVPSCACFLRGHQAANGGDDIALTLQDLQGEPRGRVPGYR